MYSDKAIVRELVALVCAHHITHAVVAAGSRNIPLSHCLASCPDLCCLPAVDERSAAFQALGLAQALQRPVIVCVTSGSALLNTAPAVAEAYYQQVPLVVLSADRPAAWIDQMDGQTIRQQHALHNVVRREVSLPEGGSPEDVHFANRLINEALLEARGPVAGPVHINVPLAEPLFGFDEPALPVPRVIRREHFATCHMDRITREQWCRASRVLLVAGQLPWNHGLEENFFRLLQQGVVVVAEHLANLGDLTHSCRQQEVALVDRADLVLAACRGRPDERLTPDLVITLGGHIVSKRLKLYLRSLPKLVHWHVHEAGEIADLFGHLECVLPTSPASFAQILATHPRVNKDVRLEHDFVQGWRSRTVLVRDQVEDYFGPENEVRAVQLAALAQSPVRGSALWRSRRMQEACQQTAQPDDGQAVQEDGAVDFSDLVLDSGGPEQPALPLTDLAVMKSFLACMPPHCLLHLGNSSPVRNAQFFDLPEDTRVFCNRGVNGIDGSLSTALGCAQASSRQLYCCIGDLSFFYDANALWREKLPDNLHIVLFNNGGGNIFRSLPGLNSPHTERFIAGSNTLSATHLAQACGLAHFPARTIDEFRDALTAFLAWPQKGLLEVHTHAAACAFESKSLAAFCHIRPAGSHPDAD